MKLMDLSLSTWGFKTTEENKKRRSPPNRDDVKVTGATQPVLGQLVWIQGRNAWE